MTRRDIGKREWQEVKWGQALVGWLATAQRNNEVAVFQNAWPEEADQGRWLEDLREWLGDVAANRTVYAEALGVQHAPWRWRARLWQETGREVVEALRIRTRRDDGLLVPVREGQGLQLLKGDPLAGQEGNAIPFTQEGYVEFLERAPVAAKQHGYGYRELYAAALNWFGERIPQGLLSVKEEEQEQAA